MADAKRRWLKLQQDLGGDEVMFDQPVDVRAAVAPDPAMASAKAPLQAQASKRPAFAADPVPQVINRSSAATAGRSGPVPAVAPVPRPTAATQWATLDEIAEVVRGCKLCPLCETRTNAVPGEGNPNARLMLVGEGPGESEDLSGRPFVGRAGELLTKMLEAIQVPRADAYIANVVKCRPPKNRVPLPDERAACMPYLHRQIALVKPKVLLALGTTASAALLDVKSSLGALRSRTHDWNGIPLIVTYHPAALLRNPDWKRPAWDDLRTVRQLLDRDS
ncbi:MAG: uracil-DNA glycosylase family protein [Gemmatimonadota bacterium]